MAGNMVENQLNYDEKVEGAIWNLMMTKFKKMIEKMKNVREISLSRWDFE